MGKIKWFWERVWKCLLRKNGVTTSKLSSGDKRFMQSWFRHCLWCRIYYKERASRWYSWLAWCHCEENVFKPKWWIKENSWHGDGSISKTFFRGAVFFARFGWDRQNILELAQTLAIAVECTGVVATLLLNQMRVVMVLQSLDLSTSLWIGLRLWKKC